MRHMQNSVQQICRSQAVVRQNSYKCAKHLDDAKKMQVQKAVQENLHGVSPEVIDVEGDPTDGARKEKSNASTNKIASNEKCYFPKTPTRKGYKGKKNQYLRKLMPQRHVHQEVRLKRKGWSPNNIQKKQVVIIFYNMCDTFWVCSCWLFKPASRNHCWSLHCTCPSGEFLREDCIAQIIYRL